MTDDTGGALPVRCADCGFLTLRQPHTGDFLEADTDFRKDGHRYGMLNPANGGPLCLAAAADLYGELLAIRDTPEPARSLTIITAARDCPRFMAWRQGFSPKEHLELMYADELRKARAEQRERDLAWQEQQAEKWQQFERDMRSSEQRFRARQNWIERWWRLFIGVGAFLGGIVVTYVMAAYLGLRPNGEPANPPAVKAAP